MARSNLTETQLVVFTNGGNAIATFEGGCTAFYFSSTADVLVDFDQPTDAGSFLIKANIAYPIFDFEHGNVKQVHVRGNGGGGSLYILGVR